MGNCLKSPTSDDISLLHESQSDRASYGDGAEPDQEPPPPYQVREGAGSGAAEPAGSGPERGPDGGRGGARRSPRGAARRPSPRGTERRVPAVARGAPLCSLGPARTRPRRRGAELSWGRADRAGHGAGDGGRGSGPAPGSEPPRSSPDLSWKQEGKAPSFQPCRFLCCRRAVTSLSVLLSVLRAPEAARSALPGFV